MLWSEQHRRVTMGLAVKTLICIGLSLIMLVRVFDLYWNTIPFDAFLKSSSLPVVLYLWSALFTYRALYALKYQDMKRFTSRWSIACYLFMSAPFCWFFTI